MKLMFLLTWGDAVGGTERAVLAQANWLAQRHQVEVLGVFRTRDTPAFEVDPRVRTTFLIDSRPAVPVAIGRDLAEGVRRSLAASASSLVPPEWEGAFSRLSDLELERALRECDADVVISTTPALLAVATELLPRRVVTVHQEHRVAELRGSSGVPLTTHTPRLDAVALLSSRTRDWLAEQLAEAAPRLAVIPNALDDRYRPRSSRQTATVVMAGRLSGEKQFDHAVNAFAQIAPDHPRWRLRIFGDGPRGALESQITALHLGDQVQLMGPTCTMDLEWSKASIGLVTSRVESFGLTIVEAMNAAVPVVAYDCPNGPREIIDDGVTGMLVTPDSVDELAAALRKLIEDDDLRDAMGENAVQAVRRFSTAEVMPHWERLYTELLADREEAGWEDRRSDAIALHLARMAPVGPVTARPHQQRPDVEAWAARVEANQPDLVWTRGQLTRLRDDTTPREVAQANLDLAVDALEAAGTDHFLVRQMTPTFRLAVREEDRQEALAALARSTAARPAYLEAFDPRHRSLGAWPAAIADTVEAAHTAASVRVFEPVITTSQTLRLGAIFGCEIEFWQPSKDGSELCGPANTIAGRSLSTISLSPARVAIGDRDYRTVEPFTRKLGSELTWPIDIVYTWVDGNDPQWLRRKAETLGLPPTTDTAEHGSARYRCRNELMYSLRSVDLFAPWVNRIWIVTDRQVPSWLDTEHPRVRIVDHTEIFDEPAHLPTFNSHAIETQLHHIDGLSEHFLYLNDDVFFGRLVGPQTFFNAGGLPFAFPSPTQIPLTPVSDEDEYFAAAAKNNRALLEQAFDRTLMNAFLHAPHAHRRSTLREIEERFQAAVRRTSAAQVRTRADISMLSSLAHHYGLISGRAVEGPIRCAFANVGLQEHVRRLDGLLQRRGHDVFCLNDFHEGDVPPEDQGRLLEAFLGAYFPVPSQFERGSERNRRFALPAASRRPGDVPRQRRRDVAVASVDQV